MWYNTFNMPFLSQERAIRILQYSLGFTFVWFGILKLFNSSPVLPIIKAAMPPVVAESQLFFFLLSLLEIVIGVGFLANRFVKIVAIIINPTKQKAIILVLVTQGFDPRFPVLSLPGEFVMKNLVLMSAGLVLLSHHSVHRNKEEKKE